MIKFEKYEPYYYNGTDWIKISLYQPNGNKQYGVYIADELPIIDHYSFPTDMEYLSFGEE